MNKEECLKALDNIKMLGGINIPLESLETIENLIEEHFDKKENTAEFKHFKLHSDSTLKLMKKDELISYIHMLYHNWKVADKSKQRLHNIIDDLTENNPLEFEEIAEDEPIWDNKCGCWRFNISTDKRTNAFYDTIADEWVDFEENRFYPVSKAMGRELDE